MAKPKPGTPLRLNDAAQIVVKELCLYGAKELLEMSRAVDEARRRMTVCGDKDELVRDNLNRVANFLERMYELC